MNISKLHGIQHILLIREELCPSAKLNLFQPFHFDLCYRHELG